MRTVTSNPDGREHDASYRIAVGETGALRLQVRFVVEERDVLWKLTLSNETDHPLEIGDLALPLPVNRNRGRQNEPPPGPPILKHSLVSGHGSFHFWMKGDSVGPFLTLTQDENTKLEYWESQVGDTGPSSTRPLRRPWPASRAAPGVSPSPA